MSDFTRKVKIETMKACRLTGATRAVYHALVTAAGFNARVQIPYRELATIAGVAPVTCSRALECLTETHYITVLEQGHGRRPSILQVARWEKTSEPIAIIQDESKANSVVLSFPYVVPSVNP